MKSDLGFFWLCTHQKIKPAKLAGAVEYTVCISAEGLDPHNRCPRYDIKQYGGEAPDLMLGGMWSSPSLSLFPVFLRPGVVAPDRVLSIGQIEMFDI